MYDFLYTTCLFCALVHLRTAALAFSVQWQGLPLRYMSDQPPTAYSGNSVEQCPCTVQINTMVCKQYNPSYMATTLEEALTNFRNQLYLKPDQGTYMLPEFQVPPNFQVSSNQKNNSNKWKMSALSLLQFAKLASPEEKLRVMCSTQLCWGCLQVLLDSMLRNVERDNDIALIASFKYSMQALLTHMGLANKDYRTHVMPIPVGAKSESSTFKLILFCEKTKLRNLSANKPMH
ncbi:unnamed protein product [Soboliphyme baturini]|uniref:Interleukin-12 subunit alpha n=1 Tax=Soboliphyme baturini TaxID=241478 RepID=A0A183IK96_9BILA|nr:unnamed protein product [Soboliphyme baturini]